MTEVPFRVFGQNEEEVIVQRKLSVKQLSYAATPGGGFTHAFVSRNPYGSLLFYYKACKTCESETTTGDKQDIADQQSDEWTHQKKSQNKNVAQLPTVRTTIPMTHPTIPIKRSGRPMNSRNTSAVVYFLLIVPPKPKALAGLSV
jgi:hypothetical protein